MEWYQLSNEDEVASPGLLIFEEQVEHNLQAMLRLAGSPERLRPHVKTHKMGPLIRRQVALGIGKFKCATIAEAELCGREGAASVLVAYPLVGPNVQRFVALVKLFPTTRFAAMVDSAPAIVIIDSASLGAGIKTEVFLDVDCGQHRTGVTLDTAPLLYRQISQSAGLHAAGLHAYDGHLHDPDPVLRRSACEAAFAPVLALRRALISSGFAVPVLIAGGSPTFPFHAEHSDRECSPGTPVLWDFGYADAFPELPFLPAAVLLTRVISKPGSDRLCLDLGHKAVAAENPHPRVRFLELPEATAIAQSEEHLVIATPRAKEFAIGDTLHGIPRHVCPTVALYDEATLVRAGAAAEIYSVAARTRRLTV